MATKQTITIPDLGDFSDVEVIEVLVKAGDTVKKEDSLIVLETDKASMEVPSPYSGTIVSLTVEVGARVSPNDSIGEIEVSDDKSSDDNDSPKKEHSQNKSEHKESSKTDNKAQSNTTQTTNSAPEGAVDLVVLGAGPAGYSAAFRAADLGLSVTLIERYATLGGVCLNVGCIPSKALLHVCEVMEEASELSHLGVSFSEPKINLDQLRIHKEKVIGKLTTGLASMAKARKVNVVQGTAQFSGSHSLKVSGEDGEQTIEFKQAIIAAGSQSVKLPFLPEDPRIIDSTGALALKDIPEKMLVIGGGIIGLEMATVYASLGSQIDIVEMTDNLMAGADKDLVNVWKKRNLKRFNHLMLSTKTTQAQAKDDGIYVSFEGENAPEQAQRYDRVLVAVGRSPNGKKLNLEACGVEVNERGFISVDKQMRTNQAHIFAIGDIVGQPMLAHKGVHEGHVAAEVAAGHKAYFDARVIPSVAYTSPEVAWVGVTEQQIKAEKLNVSKAVFPWAASGRAIANGCDYGFSTLFYDNDSKRIVGGAIVGPNAGDMIGEVAFAIEMGADTIDLGQTIHPHPTLGESIGMAAEVAEGTCTDCPPARKK